MALVTENFKSMVDQTALTPDEKLASLFHPDTLVSVEYFQNLRRWSILEPEKRLMLAILEDAVNCFQDNVLAPSSRRKRLFEEAEEWILGASKDWIFSFENICAVLGFSPHYIRQGLLGWKEKKQPKPFNGKAWDKKKMAG